MYLRLFFVSLLINRFALKFQDNGNSFTKKAGAPLCFATLFFAPLSFAQNQRKVEGGSENAPKGKRKWTLAYFGCPLKEEGGVEGSGRQRGRQGRKRAWGSENAQGQRKCARAAHYGSQNAQGQRKCALAARNCAFLLLRAFLRYLFFAANFTQN